VRPGVADPLVRPPADAAPAVHGDHLAGDELAVDPLGALAGRGCDDVDLVAAPRESGGEALGEARGTVHLRLKGVAADEDLQRSHVRPRLFDTAGPRAAACRSSARGGVA